MRTLNLDLMRSLVALAFVLTLVAGCGDGDSNADAAETVTVDPSVDEASVSAAEEASRSAEQEQARLDRIAAQQARHRTCERLVGPLADALQEIDSRLGVGLNYDEYGNYLGDVQVVYDRFVDGIDVNTASCTRKVGLPLEKAYNKYLKVYRIWDACLDDYYCDFSEGETNRDVQKAWAEATGLIDRAQQKLDDMAP